MKVITALVNGYRVPMILNEKPCKECNALFQPVTQKIQFCSSACRKRAVYRSKHKANIKYKDKTRHAGKREELIHKTGLTCTKCGKVGSSYQIVAHHITGNNQEHEHQELLCRACHCRLHQSVEKKVVTAEQIDKAIKTTKNLDEAAKKVGLNRSSLFQKRKKLGLQMSELYKHNLTR